MHLTVISSKRDSSGFLLVLSSQVSAFHVLQRAHPAQNFLLETYYSIASPASARHGLMAKYTSMAML